MGRVTAGRGGRPSTDKVTSFFQDYPDLRGDDLRLKLEEVVQDWKTETTRFEFNQEAEFLEESDLTILGQARGAG